ncbi:MAG: ABC transporter permease [Gemmatimonadaceae bacterium]|jgi:ABC-2 type transport system permease protein|nr:ABC transporter permease [Gemmatimonadaceae bacterium]
MRIESLTQLTSTRLREFLREPEAVFWTFVFPLLLAGGLAIAFREKPADQAIIATIAAPAGDSLASAIGRELATVAAAKDAPIATREIPADSINDVLRAGTAALVVVPQAGGGVEYRYDAARPEARIARQLVDDLLQRARGRQDVVPVKEVTVRERGSRYIDFFVPGLLAMNIMGSSIWSLAFAIVTQRNKKVLKRLAATPMSRMEYLLSFVLFRLIFLVLEIAIMLAFGSWVLDVPIRGSIITLVLVALVGAASFGAIGLLLSSRTKTVEGISGLANFVMLPMWIFSGVFFSATNFPAAIQPVIQALPLTALVNGMRAIMLQGAGLGTVWPQLAVLGAYLVVSLLVALRIFRWQ